MKVRRPTKRTRVGYLKWQRRYEYHQIRYLQVLTLRDKLSLCLDQGDDAPILLHLLVSIGKPYTSKKSFIKLCTHIRYDTYLSYDICIRSHAEDWRQASGGGAAISRLVIQPPHRHLPLSINSDSIITRGKASSSVQLKQYI